MGTTEVVDVTSKLASLGMSRDWEEDGPISEEVDTEEDNESEPDDEDQVDASESDDEPIDDEDQEDSDSETEEDKRVAAAEAQMRTWQSRHDKLSAEMEVIRNQFQQLHSEFLKKQQPNELDGLDDDDIVDVKTVKKMLAEKGQGGIPAETAAANQQQQQAEFQWVSSQADYAQVVDYVNKNKSKLESDPSLPQGTTALYFAVKERMARDKAEALEKEKSQLLKKRKGVPPTGASGRGKAPSRGSSGKGTMASQFESLGKKLGLDLTAR